MSKKTIIITAVLALLVLVSTPAFALDMEYYTYGGFGPIVLAFNKIALIFRDHDYQGLLFVITVLGLMASATAWMAKAATGMKIIPMIWAIPVMFGVVAYLALFVPKGNITVYDTVLNRFQTIGGIPDGVVFTAGFLNKIEKGVVDIIETAATPDTDYRKTAGGIGFQTLESVRGSSPKNSYVWSSAIRYTKDCVSFELMRPGTTLSLDELRNETTDFLNDLGKAVNPSVFTVYYEPAHPEGTAMSCTDAWNRLRQVYANPNNYTGAIKKLCGKAHFDPNNQAEINTCKRLLTSTMRFVSGMTVTPEKILQQRQIAEILYRFYFMDDYETAMLMDADRRITTNGLGIGLTMNEWIPIIRAIMTAIAIGMIPFLVLFLPTPIFGRAASVMFGFFVFLVTWGITDAVIHGAAMDYASYAFEGMRQSNLGVYAMASFPTLSVKMLGMFGVIRSAGIMLASIFSMMLIRFGGSALAHLATNLTSIARNIGAQTGKQLTPEGTAAALNEEVRAGGLLAGIPEHRYTGLAHAEIWGLHRKVAKAEAAMNMKKAMLESGLIPYDTSDPDIARMMESARMSAGTDSGPVEMSMSADGSVTRMQSKTVNPDGSTTVMTTGPGGAGMAMDTMGAGSATYSVGDDGGLTLTRASINGLAPVTVGTMAQHQMVTNAAHNLGSSTNWNTLWEQLQKDGVTSSTARSFANRLDNAVKANWKRAFDNKSSFVHSMDEITRTQFLATIGAGFKKIQMGTRGQVTVLGNDGETVSFNVSEDTANAFARDQARVRSEALQETLQNSEGLDYMTRMAKQMGASEAYNFLRDAKELKSSTESYGADLTTALVRNYAIERYGSDDPEFIRKSIDHFNYFLTRGGRQGLKNVNDTINGFVSGRGYGWGRTTSDVQAAMEATRARVGGQDILKGAVDQATSTASMKSSGINQGSFSAPASDIPMREPDGSKTIHDADSLHQVNRAEEAGRGRIQTTPAGMAKEGVGKVFQGVVDSQGNRPTDDGYFNEIPTPVDGMNMPGSGPIPKDAPSTMSPSTMGGVHGKSAQKGNSTNDLFTGTPKPEAGVSVPDPGPIPKDAPSTIRGKK